MSTKLLYLVAFIFSIPVISQDNKTNGNGSYEFNSENLFCLSDGERDDIISYLKANKIKLNQENKLALINKNIPNPLFIWPVQNATNNNNIESWAISNYLDHNPAFQNQLQDYNCGTRTYDTSGGYNHRGLDIYTWPFSWSLMDNSAVEIIAASAGQIIGKFDGNFDRSCSFNNNQWNAVYVRHNDGSVAWYGHMKNGSLTTKSIGDSVTQGEYLGVIGSSGNSTGPHLHFEVWEDDSYTQLIDPYTGPCNNLNTETWWQDQKPYNNPSINALLTHTNHPEFNFNNCPTTEVTYVSNQFNLNDLSYFYLYLKDQYIGAPINIKIIRPNGTLLLNSNVTANSNFSSSYWWWSRTLDMEGEWQWQATFEGETQTHTFNVGVLGTTEESFEVTQIYPNPSGNIVNIKSNSIIKNATIVNVFGKTILKKSSNTNGIKKLDLSAISNGMYFLTLEGSTNQKKTLKIIKK